MDLMQLIEAASAQPAASAAAGTDAKGGLAAVMQMVQAQPGGLAGVLEKFEANGLGGLVQSWIGAGPNQPVAPAQVHAALGPQPVAQVAQQLGTSHDQAASLIAQLLPLVVDHLTPQGQLPAGGGLGQLGALLGALGR